MKLLFFLALLIALATAYPKYYRDIEGFIVGGQNADIADFPYSLSLRRLNNHICGASVISDRWALTAAHCLPGVPANQISFRGGSANRLSGGVIFNADQVHMHPQYNSPTPHNNDVGLVRVTANMVGTNIEAVNIAAIGDDLAGGIRVLISGWGATQQNGALSNALQWVEVGVVSRSSCTSVHGINRITTNMICASDFGRDACQGDSGSPLTTTGHLLHGVASFGFLCGNPVFPTVYARVGAPAIRSWIATVTEEYSSPF